MQSLESQPLNHAIVEHLPSLRRRARTLCRNEFDAEDLVSDTVSRAIVHANQFENGTNLRAWLHRIQFHCFVSGHRRKKRERAAMERFTYECSTDEPVMQQGSHELSNRVVLAMAELPESMQAVVELVDLCDLSYREAAEELKVPVGTIMSRLFRGRNRLATQLSNALPVPIPNEDCAVAA
jgi:RNA polymerase sigma-70 factor (ECF subfamily)